MMRFGFISAFILSLPNGNTAQHVYVNGPDGLLYETVVSKSITLKRTKHQQYWIPHKLRRA